MTETTQNYTVQVTLDLADDWQDEPLKVISGIANGLQHLDDKLTEAVHLAREQGATWEEIGRALGVSRQSAWERFFSTD